MTKVIVIAGPTASGKSACAISLAAALGGDIINADAMQIYADLSVLTARPSSSDQALAPHRLYGIADGAAAWSAGIFAQRASAEIDNTIAQGRVPIIVGGTGLWLKALVTGLSPIPDVPDGIVRAAEARVAAEGLRPLREDLLAVDPVMARLEPGDTQRHLRAWSVYVSTGKPLSTWQAMPPVKVTDVPFRTFLLCPPRDLLYDQCNRRLLTMVQQGAMAEVEALKARALPTHLPVMKAVGVPEFMSVLHGSANMDEAIALAQQSTRRLAKRQMTWFRGQADDWPQYEKSTDLIAAAIA